MRKFLYAFVLVLLGSGGLLLATDPGGEDTQLDFMVVGPVPEDDSWMSPLWKKCSLQAFGRLASTQPYLLTYSFWDPATSGTMTYANGPGAGRTKVAFSAEAKASIRAVLDSIETTVYRDFWEVPDTQSSWGQIRFFATPDAIGAWGVAAYPANDTGLDGKSDIAIRSVYDVSPAVDWRGFRGAVPGVHGWTLILHEVGHALGLKHPFEADKDLHSGRLDCFYPDGNDPYQDADHAPTWPPTPPGTTDIPMPEHYCDYIHGQQGYNLDSSVYTVMTYRFRHLCDPGLYPAESAFSVMDKPVLKDYYYYTGGW